MRAATCSLGRLLMACAILIVWFEFGFSGCGDTDSRADTESAQAVVLTDTSFLADIVQNIAGDRVAVSSLLPIGADPHSFQPTPQDAKRVADSRIVIINVVGLEPLLDDLIAGAGGSDLLVIEAAAGLNGGLEDPHFWLDPVNVITYVENIRAGLCTVDPEGREAYGLNAEVYTRELGELDAWIAMQVDSIPIDRRLLVTNHESLGYFAKRYGFQIVGTVFPSVSGEGTPSARQLATLVEEIRASGAPAIFLEAGSTTDLAEQIASETGVRLVTDLLTHSVGEQASTYLDMMRWNVARIVETLR